MPGRAGPELGVVGSAGPRTRPHPNSSTSPGAPSPTSAPAGELLEPSAYQPDDHAGGEPLNPVHNPGERRRGPSPRLARRRTGDPPDTLALKVRVRDRVQQVRDVVAAPPPTRRQGRSRQNQRHRHSRSDATDPPTPGARADPTNHRSERVHRQRVHELNELGGDSAHVGMADGGGVNSGRCRSGLSLSCWTNETRCTHCQSHHSSPNWPEPAGARLAPCSVGQPNARGFLMSQRAPCSMPRLRL